ncbi:uncharacterized protein PgNI_12058 [Pyricularia grisea]|uniref:Isotrichodermin C-15 hydroxylase n=1 Tax=Pyricularia grisea TaxID=148305 RepID=A0A6P8AQD6_PYRGI|nr:uncharacterized protein PgNI_12058 [Pyricularia grisea]TLD04263.1 hypothetical protein PgNI_12058 [Pyricularia grisea]
MVELHHRYGAIVRIAPNELSFARPDAWKDVMGYLRQGQPENSKDPIAYHEQMGSLITMERTRHGQIRRSLSHGFSARRMFEQQPLIQKYIDLLFEKLHSNSDNGTQSLDIVAWYNYTTFDVIGDLTFGESFHCLENHDLHPWVKIIFKSIKGMILFNVSRHFFSSTDTVVRKLLPFVAEAGQQHEALIFNRVSKRLEMKTDRPDFMDSMRRQDVTTMTMDEICKTSGTIIIAGSETTATVLSFATYLLCKHPEICTKAVAEVRAAFATEQEIDAVRVQHLEYLSAVLNETMRLYPAVPWSLTRRTPPEGNMVCGDFIPGDCLLTISQWTMAHYEKNFAQPEIFAPDRWLPTANAIFKNDKKMAFQPFSHGSRDCIGKNLAYTEMRIILARMLWNFDIQLDNRSENWADNMQVFGLWDKPPQYVYLKPRKVEV